MTRSRILHSTQILVLVGIAIAAFSLASTGSDVSSVHALPEFAGRTGEPCATCHVSPGGGGPRTLRGMLWAAQGRPDQVPVLEGILLAPGVDDPQVLYDAGCASCHGFKGEGLFGTALAGAGISEGKVRNTVLRGKTRSGMPSFEGQFTDEQLDILVEYVVDLSAGKIVPPDSFPLPAGQLICESRDAQQATCGGN